MKTYSRRELYALGETLGESVTTRKVGGGLILGGGGSGGGGGGQSTSTSYQTNIPEYAKPYVETMLGATQKQLFQTRPTEGGGTEITGFQPYKAYGGTYDAQGNQTSYDPSKAIAGFSPLQQQAQKGIAGLTMPGEYNTAQSMATGAGQGAMNSAAAAYNYGDQGQQSGLQGQKLGIAGGQYYGAQGAGYGAQGAGYGAQGAGYGAQGADYGAQGADYGSLASTVGAMGLQAQKTGQQIGNQAQNYAAQAAGAGDQYAKMATSPTSMQSYMSPYMQNVVDAQNLEAKRQAGIAGTQQQSEATKAGAFGGGRDAIMRAERERNLSTMMNQNQAQGLQSAYQQAQQAQQFGAGLGLQGLSGAQQGLGTALQGGQLGLSGIGTALQGLQGGMQGAGIGIQGAQTGIQGAQTGIQGAQTGIQGAQTGLQGVNTQLAGTAQGMQGAQVGLQGVQGAQAGYGLANQAASNLSNITSQEQQGQLGMLNAQNAMGAQQQAQQQQIINQSMQDYANAQQYPLMQLGTMSNMIRGLPMQAQTTNQYAAAPNMVTQGIGAAGAAANLYNAMKAEGGVIKSMASGGITSIPSYDVGGRIRAQLENMDARELQQVAKNSESPEMQKMAKDILSRSAPVQAASGGVMHFVEGDEVESEKEFLPKEGIMMAKAEIPKEDQPSGRADIRGLNAAPVLNNVGQTSPSKAFPTGPLTSQGIMTNPAYGPSPAAADLANKAITEAGKSAEERRAELEKQYGPNESLQNLRAQEQERKANLGDELARQRSLRMAEFFASWGSTPGSTLVAGMTALRKSIPGIIEDDKEAKKLQREADKVIYELDQAARNEKIGLTDKAAAQKLEATKMGMEFQKVVETAREKQLTAASHIRGSELSKEGHIAGARIQAEATTAATNQRMTEDAFNKLLVADRYAQEAVANAQKEAENLRQNQDYRKHADNISRYDAAVKEAEKKGKKPESVSSFLKEEAEKSRQALYGTPDKPGLETRIKAKIEKAEEEAKRARAMAEAAATKTGNAPPSVAPSSNRPSLSDPSLQRQQ